MTLPMMPKEVACLDESPRVFRMAARQERFNRWYQLLLLGNQNLHPCLRKKHGDKGEATTYERLKQAEVGKSGCTLGANGIEEPGIDA